MLPQVEAALIASKKPYKLVPVRFVEEGGTKMGHTVIMNWEAKVRGGVRYFRAPAATHYSYESMVGCWRLFVLLSYSYTVRVSQKNTV